ncbi:glycine rich domain-containing protein [Cohnella fermenti]|nr:glycine rich domain-containing protein [Cohnella fermenti]
MAVYSTADCDCVAQTTLPTKAEISGEVPATSTTIGQKVTVQVNLSQTADPTSLEKWKAWSSDKTNFTIRIKLWRSDNPAAENTSNTGAPPSWSTLSLLTPDTAISVTQAQLISYLSGGAASQILYYDDLTNYPIPEGGKISFLYNASVYITAKDKSGNTITKQCAVPSQSVDITWNRPVKDKPEVGHFTSVPKYFSEIKEGSPQLTGTGSNETFDAMSGTPTTRSLYFASGGSEFIVDIQVEYVPQVTQTRTYKSQYTAVVNGWAMEKITGSAAHDSVPSQPEARTKVDSCAAPYTESVTLQSAKHVTKAAVPCSGDPCVGGEPEESHMDYWWVQGGYDSHTVGGESDSWTQTVTFDYMKINKAAVWKLEKSKVDGMTTLVKTNEVTASVTQGDPTIFYNIASSNTSAAGRLRYSLEPNQHDAVVWQEGNSDNCLSNSITAGPVVEQTRFKERREKSVNVTAVSDFLILQTSQGDQSVMYFQKQSNTAKTTEQLDVPTTDFDTMWTNNALSAAKWDPKTTIKVGSYNGNFSTPANKYSGGASGTVATIFDTLPAGLVRPSRPSPYMRVMATGLDVPDTLANGEYLTGDASVFYTLMFPPYNPDHQSIAYNTGMNSRYSDNGQEFASAYSASHQKVNNVVIHDPVSVQNATVISLPASLDQRTTASKAIGGNTQEAVAEYERVLNPAYRQNLIANPDAEYANVDGTAAGWNTYRNSGSASDIAYTTRANDPDWTIAGTRSFEVFSLATSTATGGYWKDIPVKPNTKYKFDADVSCHRCTGGTVLDYYTAGKAAAGGGLGKTSYVTATSSPVHQSYEFTTPSNVSYVRVHLYKGPNASTAYPYDYLFVDNLSLVNVNEQEFVEVEPVAMTQEVANPDYVPAQSTAGTTRTFDYTGGVQTFTAPSTGTYTLEVWGAEGGRTYYNTVGNYGMPGLGGYAKGEVSLAAGQQLDVYVGGAGGQGANGGWNGGGKGTEAYTTSTGGGATDIRMQGTSPTTLYQWDFVNSTLGFTSGTSAIHAGTNVLDVNISSPDGYFYSPLFSTITGEAGDIIEIRLKNVSSGTAGQVYFSYGGGMSESRMVSFTMSANDSDYQMYQIDPNAGSGWGGGLVNYLRFDLANGASSGIVYVDYIKIRRTNSLGDRLIVAGGGGGTEYDGQSSTLRSGAGGGESGGRGLPNAGSYPNCPGYGGTQTAGGAGGACGSGSNAGSFGQGGAAGPQHSGGGGGGWYGGGSGGQDGGGGGGSGYIGGVSNGTMASGVQSGNGKAIITLPSSATDAVGSPTRIITVLVGGADTSPPADAYMLQPIAVDPNSGAGGFTPGNFVLLDYGFQMYFPNTGDFYGNGQWGWPATTATRGKGFTDGMDTTEWTKAKYVKFAFNVIYDGTLYKANQWISLPVAQTMFDFYVPLANREKISALVEWKSMAINAAGEDGTTTTNKARYGNLAAKHSTNKKYEVDVVGRIGNMAIEDTGDFRFSNLFKQPVVPTQWLVNNLVKRVNPNAQNQIVGDTVDIRGQLAAAGTDYLNTWGLLSHLEQSPITFPLSAEKNNIAALRKQPLRLGYEVLTDIQTIGNYYSKLQIIPYYYHLNLKTGKILPVDIYMNVNGQYKRINKFGALASGGSASDGYANPVKLNWDSQAKRRNVSDAESELTSRVAALFAQTGGDSQTGKAAEPSGIYTYGTSQLLQLTGRNRTFIGQDATYGDDKNPGNSLSLLEYAMQAQRWHYSFLLPSSAVAVESGQPVTKSNIEALRTNTGVLVLAADILAVGDTYTLHYKGNGNGTLNLAGTSWSLSKIDYPVVAVYSAHKSSADDLEVSGTH